MSIIIVHYHQQAQLILHLFTTNVVHNSVAIVVTNSSSENMYGVLREADTSDASHRQATSSLKHLPNSTYSSNDCGLRSVLRFSDVMSEPRMSYNRGFTWHGREQQQPEQKRTFLTGTSTFFPLSVCGISCT